MEKLIIKPCKTIQRGFLLLLFMGVILILLTGVFMSVSVNDFLMGLLVFGGGFNTFGFLVYLGVRFFYRRHYIFTRDKIVSYYCGKVVFNIKKEDIIALGYRKANWKMKMFSPIYYQFADPMTDIISIRYKKADIEGKRDFNGIILLETLMEEEKNNGLKEYVESFSSKDIKKICAMLEMDTIPVSVQYQIRQSKKRP